MSFVGDVSSDPSGITQNQDNSLFIWLDVLGFADAVDKEEKYKELSELLKKFQHLFIDSNSYHTTIISDGLILYIKNPKSVKDISLLFIEIAKKQFQFILENNYFIRGGIAVGSRYESDDKENQFISNGLSRAYNLESNNIHWPIVAIDEKNLERLNRIFNTYDKKELFGLEVGFNKNGSTLYFIDFIQKSDEYLELLKNKTLEFQETPSVKNKYLWLIRYYLHKFENSREDLSDYLKGVVL